jgi:hypothetical protein
LGELPFIYPGLSTGANTRKEATWKPAVIKVLQKILHSWKNRYVSLGSRVILINSTLAAIPTFYLSFMKMPIIVLKKMVMIQKNFMCDGANGRKKIAWVKWADICRSKECGAEGLE